MSLQQICNQLQKFCNRVKIKKNTQLQTFCTQVKSELKLKKLTIMLVIVSVFNV